MGKRIAEIADLTPDSRNANRGTERGRGLLERSLRQYGAGRSVLADKHGTIIAGNKTVEASAELGLPVRVVETDGHELVVVQRRDLDLGTDKAARELAYADNRVAQLDLDWATDLLLADQEAGVDLSGVGFTDAELAALFARDAGGTEGLTDPDAVPPVPAVPITQPGDRWTLGGHRLLCGDSTVATDVERLFGDDRAEMVWTDPPYGVAIGDKTKYLHSIARSNRVEENLTGDTLDDAGLRHLLGDAFCLAATACEPGAAWYVAAPPGPLHHAFGSVLGDLGIWRQTLVWVKNNATFSPLGQSYHYGHEAIFYGWLPNAAHRWHGDRTQTTVWEIDRPQASPEHPTMKPVELVARALEHSSRHGEIVYDPFLGSGTTLIAAEQLGRTCYGLEISPAYCDVIVARWEQFTGLKAVREDGATWRALREVRG